MAKLLYHSSSGGRKQNIFVNKAGIIRSSRTEFEMKVAAKASVKLHVGEFTADKRSDERVSLLSTDRFVLKKSPEKIPVRKINININTSFFICNSFRSVKDMSENHEILHVASKNEFEELLLRQYENIK